MPDAPARVSLKELQAALLKIADVTSANVVGESVPAEIHVISSSRRSPKQIVRDVQSLAAARFDLKIDHRIVSVVQIEEKTVPTAAARPSIERVGLGSQNKAEWVEVSLRWPNGEETKGTGVSGGTREARARGATTAVVECLDKVLSVDEATVEVDHISIQRIGSADWVLVHTVYYQRGAATPLLGSALIHDDVATAAARALLNAVNRKLPHL